jgi:hypothetical protein
MYTEKHLISGGTCTLLPSFLGVQSLTLHLGVQRKLTAFSPHKVVHHAVFCKYYAELAKPFFFGHHVIPDTLLKVVLSNNKTGHNVLRYTWQIVESGVKHQ